MTSEATLRRFRRHRTAQTLRERFGHRVWVQDSEIEPLNFLVVTDATLVEDAPVLKYISLAGLTLAKTVEDGFGNRVSTIADGVDVAVTLADDFVVIRSVAKTQSRMRFQNLTTFGRC